MTTLRAPNRLQTFAIGLNSIESLAANLLSHPLRSRQIRGEALLFSVVRLGAINDKKNCTTSADLRKKDGGNKMESESSTLSGGGRSLKSTVAALRDSPSVVERNSAQEALILGLWEFPGTDFLARFAAGGH